MAAITICSDFGAPKNKVWHCFHFSPICHEVMGPDAMILVFWMLSFQPTFSLSSFTFIKRLFNSSSLSAIRVVSSAYLRLLIDMGSIPGSGRSPGGGHGNPLQYSCLENPMDRGVWYATLHGVTKSWTQLSDLEIPYICISIQYLFLCFWLTSLHIIGCAFIHLIRTDSNGFLFMAE